VGQLTAETLARLARSSGEVPRRPVEVDPARAASCPPGLEYLLALDGVVLKREQPSAQQLQQLRRQHNNHQHVLGSFHLYSPQGELLYFGHEGTRAPSPVLNPPPTTTKEPDGCALCCCSASSWCGKHVCEMDIRLTDLTGRDVVLIQRDPGTVFVYTAPCFFFFHVFLGWATSCMPCCPVPTNFWFQQSATIINVVSGRVMGYIHQNYSPVGLSYSVYSVRKKHSIGKEMYRAHGWPGLAFLGCVPWSTPALQIRRVGGDADDGSNNIASINSVRQRAESTLVHVRNVNDVNVECNGSVFSSSFILMYFLSFSPLQRGHDGEDAADSAHDPRRNRIQKDPVVVDQTRQLRRRSQPPQFERPVVCTRTRQRLCCLSERRPPVILFFHLLWRNSH